MELGRDRGHLADHGPQRSNISQVPLDLSMGMTPQRVGPSQHGMPLGCQTHAAFAAVLGVGDNLQPSSALQRFEQGRHGRAVHGQKWG
jgi:hypothetical protein